MNAFRRLVGKIEKKYKCLSPNGCGLTVVNAQTCLWVALPQNSVWPWPRNTSFSCC